MARIKISIDEGAKRVFHWESNEMEQFSAAVLIRSMASAINDTVDDSVMDNIIAKLQHQEQRNMRKVAKHAGISPATLYRKLPPAKKKKLEER